MGPADIVFDLADRFYEAAEDPSAMPEALSRLALSVGAHHAVTAERRLADGGWGAAAGNVDPALSQRMLGALGGDAVRVWLERFPRAGWERMCQMVPVDTPLSRALYDSAFYCDFVRPLGGHHAALTALDVGENRSFLSVFRPQQLGDYDPESMGLLEAVRPHVARAFRLRRQLSAAEASAGAAFGMLERLHAGVVIFDRRLKFLFANQAAMRLSASTEALILDGAGFRLSAHGLSRQLQALLASAAADTAPPERAMRLRVPRDGSPFPLLLQVERLETPGLRALGANVGIFIDDPGAALALDATVLVDAFGLTPREAALTTALAKGAAPRQAAHDLCMSEATAKTHLKRVLDKAGAHRTAELVGMVAALAR